MKIRRRRKQTKEVGKSQVDFGKTQERFDHVAKDTEEMEFEKSLKEHEAQYAAAKPIQDLEKLTQEEIDAVVEGDRLCRVYERREATRKFIKNVISITDARSELSQVGIKLLELLDRIEGGDTSIHREFDTTSVKFVQLCRAKREQPAETGRKEIVEVKPGAFGITVNIKEIANAFGSVFVLAARISFDDDFPGVA